MPRPTVSLAVPQPCSESWAAMSPAAGGRHCAACQKVVIDFTQKTDAELLAFLRQRPGPTCGRFAAGQLNRPLQPAVTPAPWRSWLAAAVTLLGVRELAAENAQAQQPRAEQRQVPMQAWPIEVERTAATSVGYSVIRGRVVDGSDSTGLPGATVLISNTQLRVTTNADGTFQLLSPSELNSTGSGLLVEFSSVGYLTQQVILSSNETCMVQMQTDVKGMLAGVVDVGVNRHWYAPRSIWWRLTRPFRR
ncbi:carboxypeptidase-like regulatory domain-containing protein [Hymenobacter sp. B81]|uniref:carboxypeptidase-like regulatory domain-containing protein n=1 Tax=Hymenobacter sp. B81 TaxID=3344878 RepID=UPI0037DCD810